MSSILRSLRKLEEEKSALGEGGVDIGRDILKRSYRISSQYSYFWPAFVLVMLLCGAGFGFWWFYATKDSDLRVALEAPPAVEKLSGAPQVSVVDKSAEIKTRPAVTQIVIPPSSTPRVQRSVVVAPALPVLKPEPVVSQRPAVTDIVLPDLQVDEIVYLADPASRLAVVNDLPIMEGTDIDGVRVVEILVDRVRFSHSGIVFEKLLHKKP